MSSKQWMAKQKNVEEYEKSKYDDEEFEIEIIVDNYEDTSET